VIQNFGNIVNVIFPEKDASQDITFLKLVLAALVALIVAYGINKFITRSLPRIAKTFTPQDQSKKAHERLIATKRNETLFGVAAAVGRTLVVVACLYVGWRIVNPTNTPIALIGASTFFIVLGAATLGPLLRDLTSGTLMIAEKWYNVGDHVVVDPFWDLSGVVEKVNLRSTRLRSLNGEIVWIHNQHIHAVRVTPHGMRTMSVDTFVSDIKRGKKLIRDVLKTMPTGPTMIAKPLKITQQEKLGNIWRITAEGKTTPGREWLIEDFVVKAIKKSDSQDKENSVIVQGPIVRNSDTDAEKSVVLSMSKPTDGPLLPKR